MKCEICHVVAPYSHDDRFHALAERVAKLEAIPLIAAYFNSARQPGDWTEQPDGMPVDDAKLEAAQNLAAAVLKSGARESESRPPEDESGRTAAAVISQAIPDGFALAPGWRMAKYGEYSCTHHGADGEWDCDRDAEYENDEAACPAHAVSMGALVPLVPTEPSVKSGELPDCSHDGCDRNGARCGYDDRWWCDPHWNGTAAAPQPEAPAGFIDTSIKCPVCFVHGGAHDMDTHRRLNLPPAERPAPEVAIDWSRFVPTEEIESHGDSSYLQIQTGTVYASWTIEGGSVWRAGEAWLAGRKDGSGSRWRIIRHANGRWAEGYGPDGPIAPAGPCFAESMNLRCDVHSQPAPSEPAPAPLSAATLRATWRQAEDRIADLEARLAEMLSAERTLTDKLAAAEKERDGLTLALDAANAVAESNIKAKLAAEKTADARAEAERARVNYWWNKWRTGASLSWEDRDLAIASGTPVAALPELPSGCSACGTRFGAFADGRSHRCPTPAPTVKL